MLVECTYTHVTDNTLVVIENIFYLLEIKIL